MLCMANFGPPLQIHQRREMAAKRFLITLLSLPYLLLAEMVFKFRVKSIMEDYYKCIDYIRLSSISERSISLSLIDILRVAEDHRQLLHRELIQLLF